MEKKMNTLEDTGIDKRTEYARVRMVLEQEVIHVIPSTLVSTVLLEFERNGKRVTFGSTPRSNVTDRIQQVGGMLFADIVALCSTDPNASCDVCLIAWEYWMFDDEHDDYEAGYLFGRDCSYIADPKGRHFYF